MTRSVIAPLLALALPWTPASASVHRPHRQATQSPPAMVPQGTDWHCVAQGLDGLSFRWGGRQSYFVVTTATTARSSLSCPAQPW